VVFTGDTLFNFSIGRTDFPGCSQESLMQSIFDKLTVLPDETVVLPDTGRRAPSAKRNSGIPSCARAPSGDANGCLSSCDRIAAAHRRAAISRRTTYDLGQGL